MNNCLFQIIIMFLSCNSLPILATSIDGKMPLMFIIVGLGCESEHIDKGRSITKIILIFRTATSQDLSFSLEMVVLYVFQLVLI